MLDALRQNLKQQSWPKILLVLVALSMTLYLGAYFFGDGSDGGADAPWAARIDGEPVPIARFQSLARQIDQNYRQLLGQNYSELRGQFQIGTQAIRQLVEREIILRDAQRLGLRVSDAELVERIRNRPELAGEDGRFIGKEAYERRVGRFYPGGIAAFERDLREDLLIQKWIDVVSQAVAVNDEELETLHRERTEKTALRYFLVRASDQDTSEAITEEEARAWYAEHAEDYRRDEGRRIRYVVLARGDQLEQVQFGDDELLAAYQERQEEFSHPEQRQARHILFRFAAGGTDEEKQLLRPRAEEVLERLRGGEDFAQLARELSEDTLSAQRGGDLGWFGRGQMVAPFEDAVFETPAGELAPVTETQYGLHVIQVTGERPAGVRPLEEVRDQLQRELRMQRAEQRLQVEAERVRGRITRADELEPVAQEEGLEVQSRFVSATEGFQQMAASAELRDAVQEMEAGEIRGPLRVGQGLAVVVVDELVPAGVAPYEEVATRVKTDLLNERSRRMALDRAWQAWDDGGGLDGAAAALGAQVEESGDLAPGQTLPGSGGSTPELRATLFGESVDVGDGGVVAVLAGALVYEVTRREPFDAAAFEAAKPALRAELLAERRSSIQRSIVDQLGRQLEIEINDEAVARIDGRT